jgi:isocitrate/isopropylmalate dehydrogenase
MLPGNSLALQRLPLIAEVAQLGTSGMHILVLPGDGIGPELADATLAVLGAANDLLNLGLTFERMDVGFASLAAVGSTCPESVMERVLQVDGVILGPVSHSDYPPRHEGGINPSAALRKTFDLGANIRPARSRERLSYLRAPMDLIIVREATEGFYADRNMFSGIAEFMPDSETALSVRKISAKACRRVAHAACALARERRRKVTAVHKANVLKTTDGLFLQTVREVAREYPDVELNELLVDATAALLIRSPERFDVIVTTNMFGDILSDEAAELTGGLGLAGSINVGDDVCVAQAQHGSAPDIAGQGIANPTSLILSAAMLLGWRGRRDRDASLNKASELIGRAVDVVLADPDKCTRDVGGSQDTASFTAFVITALEHRA